jgi:2-iminobutanoate/2-iminopropanoate deaminase
VEGAEAVVFVSGQAPISADGQLVGEGDFEAQAVQTFENLGTVLAQAGASFDDIVKVTVYLTEIGKLPDYTALKARYSKGPQPASTALQVPSLAHPEMMIEVEAVAVV